MLIRGQWRYFRGESLVTPCLLRSPKKKTAEAVFLSVAWLAHGFDLAAAEAPPKEHQPLHEPGRYFGGMGLVAAGPHFQEEMVLPPSVVPTMAVAPVW